MLASCVAPSVFHRLHECDAPLIDIGAETVLYDRLDPVLLDVLERAPAELSPAAAVRAAMHEVMDRLSEEEATLEQTRWRLVAAVPELRAAVVDRTLPMADLLAAVIARRLGRNPDDFEPDPINLFDRALAHLEAGLPL